MNLLAFIRKKNIKNKNYINCIIYGKNFKNLKIKLIKRNLYKKFKINLKLNIIILNKKYYVKVKDINYNSLKNTIIHIDFLIINEKC